MGYIVTAAPSIQASAAFKHILTMDRAEIQVVPGSSGDVIMEIASSGHVNGIRKTIIVPAGNATTFTLAADMHQGGDAFDASKDWYLTVEYLNSNFVTTSRAVSPREAVAATVSSLYVDDVDPTKLVVTFSERVYFPDTTGLTLTFGVGAAATVDSVASGNDTTIIKFTMSRAIVSSDTPTLVIGSTRTGFDQDGVKVAVNAGVLVTNATYPSWFLTAGGGIAAFRADKNTNSAGKVVTLVDQSGNANTLPDPGATGRAALNATDAGIGNQASMTFASGGDGDDGYTNPALVVSGVAPVLTQGHAVLLVFKLAVAGAAEQDIGLSATAVSGTDITGPILFQQAGTLYFTGNDLPGGGQYASGALANTNWHYALGVQTAAGKRDLYLDGTLLGHDDNTTLETLAIKELKLGGGISTAGFGFDGRIAEAALTAAPTSTQRAQLAVYLNHRYGQSWS